ncbi:tRNA pseudouridine(55) synthase TruB [Pseudidiomarina sediminum]|uniref:tRNA pseudouridine synthase B n=1 Tax=Pseudidiomarina sediminum TaxID=431675 RepID=A0A432Z8Q3_9GAMM|nr:tRNA pseudouridine(55) synthase TruB [Pseudidiomarina sediminum]MBY6063444.1 tRNA pseudouridine(55) synthase TruB [Pseudidiomarina sediminum]RUO74274.1 tRNA pseudouridine(55) synthase TruB [Pseudidiomarina sediminum]
MGRRKSGRDISGVIVLDKPLELTSNAALQKVRRFFNARKGGHTGALDPLATGVLPLCFGEATKLSHFALEADKTYQVTAQLGVRTTTSDAEGEVVATADVALTPAKIDAAIAAFTGAQEQSPSMYSALKYEGRPLYYYARQGIEVPRKSRTITIHSIVLLGFTETTLTLEVTCSKGTYIRTLIDDMGQYLGCGAHVAALRRTWIEGVEGDMVTLDELATLAEQCDPEQDDYAALDALLLPCDAVIRQIPEVEIAAADAARFSAGNPARVVVGDARPETEVVRVRAAGESILLGLGYWRDDKIMPKRVLCVANR